MVGAKPRSSGDLALDWRRTMPRDDCVGPWACPNVTASWCGWWKTIPAAAAAGIAEGDLIVAINGAPITSADDLLDALVATGTLDIMLIRGVDEISVRVTE